MLKTGPLASVLKPFTREPDLRAAETRVVEAALTLIRERFEGGVVPHHMHFHNAVHTAGVIQRGRLIGEALDVSEREMLLTVVAAAYHDSVQRWYPVHGEGGLVMRKRFTGRDEVASAHEAVEIMSTFHPLFTAEEMGIVASAIVGTIPGWDSNACTVSQPFLVEHPVIRAIALADLGAAGMDPDMYSRDGPALFAEENIDLMEAIVSARRTSDISKPAKLFYRGRYLAWLKIQPGFARGREQRLHEHELDGLDGEARARLLGLFSRFDESVERAEEAVRLAEALDFAPLMRQLEPGAFPDEA